jgi:hypothetical protein
MQHNAETLTTIGKVLLCQDDILSFRIPGSTKSIQSKEKRVAEVKSESPRIMSSTSPVFSPPRSLSQIVDSFDCI